MFNRNAFQEMLLPSSAKVNDYVTHIYIKYADLDGNDKTRESR